MVYGFSLQKGCSGEMTSQQVYLYTDGACLGNPGPGGWAAILKYGAHEKELVGGAPDTTNNQMELMAVISGLEALKRPSQIHIVTDSRYVMDGIQKWMANWKRNNWKTAAKKPVKNMEYWQRLDNALAPHQASWEWVKGHAGHSENERCDQLASAQAALMG